MISHQDFAPNLQPPPLQRLSLDWLQRAGVDVALLRLDLVDPELSGNKWYKLTHHLAAAREAAAPGLISLGGRHSNHLHALAAAGRRYGFATVGLLRGVEQRTPTVEDLLDFGMELHWLGYGGYRDRHRDGFWTPWLQRYPGYRCVPEGGGGLAGALGCVPLVAQLDGQLAELGWSDYQGWWLAAGTGTTVAGLVIGERGRRPVFGALAGPPSHGVDRHIERLLEQAREPDCSNYRLIDACRGGFGRVDSELIDFMAETESASGVPLEPVYTAKAMMALRRYVETGYFARGTRLVFVHTGGLQGRRAAMTPQG